VLLGARLHHANHHFVVGFIRLLGRQDLLLPVRRVLGLKEFQRWLVHLLRELEHATS